MTIAPSQRQAGMRVISLSNPWPWAMLHSDPEIVKLVENRSWPPPQDAIGTWIALHAAKSWDDNAQRYWMKLKIDGFPFRKDLYPTGKIVGAFLLDRVRTGSSENLPKDLPERQRKWFFGEFGWIMSRSVALPEPIEHKGGQGLRWLPDDKISAIRSQIGHLMEAA